MRQNSKKDPFELGESSSEPLKDYFLTLDKILSMPAPEWLVKEMIPLGGVGVLYGASGSYKSFLALHLAACCATGRDAFNGKPCKQVPVFYIAAEAANGFKLRVDAWIRHHGIRPEDLFLRPWPVYIDQAEMLETLIEEISKLNFLGEHCFVVVDTLSANFTGSENSNDMAKFVHGCIAISKQIDATVMIVHHTGKNESKGMRGHNSLSANSDFSIYMEGANLKAEIEMEKLKDSPTGRPPMKLRAIPVTLDLKAQITGSLVLEENTDFEDEGTHQIVWKCAIVIGQEKMPQKILREALMKQEGWEQRKADRAIKDALPDCTPVDAGGFIIERVGEGKRPRYITVKNKSLKTNATTSPDVNDAEW